ncbi:MAG: LysM peptidoglycan-binding domain-containing protein [Puniceicoccales bacterium]|nr:LysM peptidoglycan-binding domain-containing protein [Puniceicoccales bacterium]
MKRILVSLVKGILGVTAVALCGCATPSFFRDVPKGPSPEDTIIRRDSDASREVKRPIGTPLRPEPEPEPESEEIVIVEPEKEPAKAEPTGAIYAVQKGDCLSWLAKKYGVRLGDLLEANALDKNAKLFVGQKLILPGVTEEQLAQAAAPVEYVVQKGDCLSKIAQKYGVKISEIRAANGMKNDRIVAGKKIVIPERGRYAHRGGKKGKNFPPKAAETFAVDADGYYIVKKGDVLSKIAAQAKVSVGDLQKWNGLSDPAKIRIGQKIAVKQRAPAPVNAAAKPPATPAFSEANPVAGSASSVGRGAMDEVDFFGKIDEIPIVQVHE